MDMKQAKTILRTYAMHDDKFSLGAANMMIYDAGKEAFDNLDVRNKGKIRSYRDTLKRKVNVLGDTGALELLGALGGLLNALEE